MTREPGRYYDGDRVAFEQNGERIEGEVVQAIGGHVLVRHSPTEVTLQDRVVDETGAEQLVERVEVQHAITARPPETVELVEAHPDWPVAKERELTHGHANPADDGYEVLRREEARAKRKS